MIAGNDYLDWVREGAEPVHLLLQLLGRAQTREVASVEEDVLSEFEGSSTSGSWSALTP